MGMTFISLARSVIIGAAVVAASIPVQADAQDAQAFITFCDRIDSAISVTFTLDNDQPTQQDVAAGKCYSESLTTYRGPVRVSARDMHGFHFEETPVSVSPGTRTVVSFSAQCSRRQGGSTNVCISGH